MTPADSGRAETRTVYCVQLAAVCLMVTLLNIGFFWQREVRELDARHNLQRIVHVWDGREWYVWAIAAPLMLWLIRANPLARGSWGRSLVRLLGGSVGIYLLVTHLRLAIRVWSFHRAGIAMTPLTWTSYLHTQSVLLPLDFLTYCGFFAASLAIDYYFKHRQRVDEVRMLELRAVQLQSELDRARLSSLRGHLQPHFLFNAFNAIAMLVRQGETACAVEMIARLGDLLRLAIDHVDAPELPIAQEFEFASRYLAIERLRFSDKLQTDIALDPEAAGGLVPNLLLQPLVESAVRHGISRRVRPGFVRLHAERRNGRLHVKLRGDDPEESEEAAAEAGGDNLEVAAARSRLATMYGNDYRFEICRQDGGTDIFLDLPWKTS